jgi:hypothetical protein
MAERFPLLGQLPPQNFPYWEDQNEEIKMKKMNRRTILGTAAAMAATPAFTEGCPVEPGRQKRRSWLLA